MTIKEVLAARTAPGTWHWQAEGPGAGDIWLAGEPADPDHDHHILTPSVCESCSQRGARCLAPKEADARAIVAMDHIIDRALTVVEAARARFDAAEPFLYDYPRSQDERQHMWERLREMTLAYREALAAFDAAVEEATR